MKRNKPFTRHRKLGTQHRRRKAYRWSWLPKQQRGYCMTCRAPYSGPHCPLCTITDSA